MQDVTKELSEAQREKWSETIIAIGDSITDESLDIGVIDATRKSDNESVTLLCLSQPIPGGKGWFPIAELLEPNGEGVDAYTPIEAEDLEVVGVSDDPIKDMLDTFLNRVFGFAPCAAEQALDCQDPECVVCHPEEDGKEDETDEPEPHDEPKRTPFKLVDSIIAYENGDLSYNETLELFQHLVDTGQAWKLQGSYGRTARIYLEAGLIVEATRERPAAIHAERDAKV